MREKLFAVTAIGLSCLIGSPALAQTAGQTVAPAEASPAAAAPQMAPAPAAPAPAAPSVVPNGTPIVVEITDLVSSKTALRDDMFNLTLAEPIKLNDVIVIPAGTPGKGQVIDSARPGMAGKSGKLVLSARYLEFEGKQIPIRGLKLNFGAKDNSSVAMATSMAVGIFGLAVTGGDIEVPAGTRANAKLGIDFAPASAAAPASVPPTTGGAEPSATPSAAPPATSTAAPAASPQQ